MTSRAIESDKIGHTCMKCGKEFDVPFFIFKIGEMGYGSMFDSLETEIHLCEDCFEATPNIWSGDIVKSGDFEKMKDEEDILEFIESFPMNTQELFFNTLNKRNFFLMQAQDWIDWQEGRLSKEKCQEYGFEYQEEID